MNVAGDQPVTPRPPGRTKLCDVNMHLTCGLCFGYYIDATTIVECLHSFCRSCIVKHLRFKSYCPICEVMINTAKPNIKPDKTLQDIVYKLVPGLHRNEMKRRRRFYASHTSCESETDSEQRGIDNERVIYDSKDKMSLSLEYFDGIDLHPNNLPLRKQSMGHRKIVNGNTCDVLKVNPSKRYLECSAGMAIRHLKKFVVAKFDIDTNIFHADILYKGIPLLDHYTIMDIAYIYSWKRNEPMRFFFQVVDLKTYREQCLVKEEPNYLIKRTKLIKAKPKKVVCDNKINREVRKHFDEIPNNNNNIDVKCEMELNPKTDVAETKDPEILMEKVESVVIDITDKKTMEIEQKLIVEPPPEVKVECEEPVPEKFEPVEDIKKTAEVTVEEVPKDPKIVNEIIPTPDSKPEKFDSSSTNPEPIKIQPDLKDPNATKVQTDQKPPKDTHHEPPTPIKPIEETPADLLKIENEEEKSMFLNTFQLTSTKSLSPKKAEPVSQNYSTLKLILERIPSTSGVQKLSPFIDYKNKQASPKQISPKPKPKPEDIKKAPVGAKRKYKSPGRPPGKKRALDQCQKIDKYVISTKPNNCPVTKMVKNVTSQSNTVNKLVGKNVGPILKRKSVQEIKEQVPAKKMCTEVKKEPKTNGILPHTSPKKESQTQVLKSLFDSCNLNIPSSLSITLTDPEKDENSPSQSVVSAKKSNSPPNMYIEIFKIPEKPDNKILPGQSILKKTTNRPIAPKPVISDGFVVPNTFTSPRIIQQNPPVLPRPGTPRILPVPNQNVKVAIPNSNFIVTTTGIHSLGHKQVPKNEKDPPKKPITILQNEILVKSKPEQLKPNSKIKVFASAPPGKVAIPPTPKPGAKLAESGFQKMFEEAIKRKEEARAQEMLKPTKNRNHIKIVAKSVSENEPEPEDPPNVSNPAALDLSTSPLSPKLQNNRAPTPFAQNHIRSPTPAAVSSPFTPPNGRSTSRPTPEMMSTLIEMLRSTKRVPPQHNSTNKTTTNGVDPKRKPGKPSSYQSNLITSSESNLSVDTDTSKTTNPAQLSPDSIQQQYNLTNLAQLNASVGHMLMLRQQMEMQNRLGAQNPWMMNANAFMHFDNYMKSLQQAQQNLKK